LRFDFTHFKAIEKNQIDKVENCVNEWILEDVKVDTVVMNPDKAKKEGAMALFGEKYGDKVRVVSMGGVSKELCGGTHVSSTGRIGLFHIIEESSISAGVRRIEAITGLESLKFLHDTESVLNEAAALFKTSRSSLLERLKATLDTVTVLETKHAALSADQASLKVGLILETALANKESLKWNVQNMGAVDKKTFGEILNAVSDAIKQKKLDTTVVVLAGVDGGAVMLAACAGADAVKQFGVHCGEIVKAASVIVHGSGGGSPGRAQAGGKDPSRIDEALAEAARIISTKIKAAP
jgi:alanyl-tRNA synthetase